MSDDLDRQRALNLIQTADVSSLLRAIEQVVETLRPQHPELPDVSALFLRERKRLLQQELEHLETSNPALAARLQALIDRSCTRYPFSYDGDS